MRSAALTLVALLLAGAWSPPVGADHHLVQLDAGGGPDGGWASFRVVSDGSPFTVRIGGEGLGAREAWGLQLFDSGRNAMLALAVVWLGDDDGLHLSTVGEPNATVLDVREPERHGGDGALHVAFNSPGFVTKHKGAFRILVWKAGDQSSFFWEVRGAPGTNVTASVNGTEATLYDERDLRGPLGAAAYEDATGARAALEAREEATIADELYGLFARVGTDLACVVTPGLGRCLDPVGADRLVHHGPRRSENCGAACLFDGDIPGNHTFSLTGADASARRTSNGWCDPALACASAKTDRDRVVLVVVDARLAPNPPP